MTIRQWLSDRALDVAVWLDSPADAFALPDDMFDMGDEPETFSVNAPPVYVTSTRSEAARLLRHVASDVELGIVQAFQVEWDGCGAVGVVERVKVGDA